MRQASITMTLGVGLLGTAFFAFSPDEDHRPWDANEAGYVQARVFDSSHRRNRDDNVVHKAYYDFTVNGERYTGEYSCLCDQLELANPGRPLPVEYRLDDPKVNRPAGIVTAGRNIAYRALGLIGAILIGVALVMGLTSKR